MIELDIDRIMGDPHEPSLPAAGRIIAVEEYLAVLDEFVPLIQNQLAIRANARAESEQKKRGEIDADNVESAHWIAVELVPSSTYGSAVLAICSALETSMAHILLYLTKKNSQFREVRKPSNVSLFEHQRAEFARGIVATLNVPSETLMALDDLVFVRNILAHSGDSIRDVKDSRNEKLQRIVGAGVGMSFGVNSIIVGSQFAHRGLRAVDFYLSAILKSLFESYPHRSASNKS